jgi:hypothetical protein
LSADNSTILPGASPLDPGTLGAALLAFQRSKGMKVTKEKVIGRIPRLRRRTIRLTDYEELRLKEQAAVAGLSVSAYMRRLFSNSGPILARTDLRMIRELLRLGGLLKSNFVTLRQAGASPDLLEYMEELLRKTGKAIDRIADGGDDR